MKNIFLFTLLFISVNAIAQSPPDDFFKPYQYPKAYTHDGAFNIIELNAIVPSGSTVFGGDVKFDLKSFQLGTPAVRLNIGTGVGYSSQKNQENFAPTPLLNGFGENSITDLHEIVHLSLYPRLWIRVLNPLNISIAGGPVGYMDQNKTTGRFSVHGSSSGAANEHVIEPSAQNSSFGAGYFYEAKAMINFKNWGISGGASTLHVNNNSKLQPVVGLWFGAARFKRVVN